MCERGGLNELPVGIRSQGDAVELPVIPGLGGRGDLQPSARHTQGGAEGRRWVDLDHEADGLVAPCGAEESVDPMVLANPSLRAVIDERVLDLIPPQEWFLIVEQPDHPAGNAPIEVNVELFAGENVLCVGALHRGNH